MKKPIILFFILILIISATNAFSDESASEEKPFDCVTALMSRPSCVNRINATNACKLFENSPKAVSMLQKCIADQGFVPGTEIMAPRNIVTLCLMGSTSTNKAKDNETFCKVGDEKKSLSITDTQMPKETHSDGNMKVEKNSIQK